MGIYSVDNCLITMEKYEWCMCVGGNCVVLIKGLYKCTFTMFTDTMKTVREWTLASPNLLLILGMASQMASMPPSVWTTLVKKRIFLFFKLMNAVAMNACTKPTKKDHNRGFAACSSTTNHAKLNILIFPAMWIQYDRRERRSRLGVAALRQSGGLSYMLTCSQWQC